jgi:hypothetical protein
MIKFPGQIFFSFKSMKKLEIFFLTLISGGNF